MSDLPSTWTWARLDDVAEVRLGRQRSPKNHSGTRMRPYLRAANVTWDGLALGDVNEMNFTEAESAIYELQEGDVLVAEASGSADEVGKPAVWRGGIDGCCFQNTLIRVRARGALPDYLRYFLLSEARSGRIGRASPGVGIHHIGSARLSAWPIPVPPLAEQQRIVGAIEKQLSRLDKALADVAAASARLARLEEAIFARLAKDDWPRVELGELLSEPLRNGVSAKASASGTVRIVTLTAVTKNAFKEENTKLADVDARRVADLWLDPGDVLIERSNTPELVGTAALYRGPREWAIFPDLLIRVRTTDEVLPEFLSLFLRTRAARAYFRNAAQGISGSMPKIGQEDIRRLVVPVPSIAEQRAAVVEAEHRLALLASLRQQLGVNVRRSNSLRGSILASAFRGELVPQDPDDEPASVLLGRIAAERAAASRPARRHGRAASGSAATVDA